MLVKIRYSLILFFGFLCFFDTKSKEIPAFPGAGLLELFTGGVELLLSQLAIAIRIRLRKPLEQSRQLRFGELSGLCI